MNEMRNALAIALAAAVLSACGSLDTMLACAPTGGGGWNTDYASPGPIGTRNPYTYDDAGCAAAKAEKETQAYYREKAERQARNGSSYDKFSLGEKYETGGTAWIDDVDGTWRGESVDLKKSRRRAIYWYKEAVKQGGSGADKAREALIRLGKTPPETPPATLVAQAYDAHKKGDDAEAVRLWRRAAEKGNASAQYNLGWAHANGRGVAQNDVEAARWYRKAAEQGDAAAQNSLGAAYEQGRGVAQNDVEAVRWFRLAAEQDHVLAQYNLAWMYENGRGVAKDLDEAIRWYRKAAENGDEKAQNALARIRASIFRHD
ncbi:tetratricopeptide repeat protein [Hyphococcus flavus]|jgi:hypothetical protein|uniref:Tetratricopeptide repeat protein n=1 Tax=Hyphococcus flavus TaxID=1866326 RepID=A0AAE9ZIZ9_9PROT|nr:tetratricopeptide repeat protein [Hyphococcus flavus]WDI31926.1 tetratricopeptide repeat protein [Hyphococcus flavus]